ncbi:MAG: tetratricopeptide repeat protein [Bacteroidia bacterium]
MRSRLRYILTFSLFAVVVLCMVYCSDSTEKKTTGETVSAGPTYLNHSDSAHYVGMGQCRLCHQDIYNSFIETGMGKSFDHASRKKSSAKFEKHTVVYDKFRDFYYHPFWNNDSLMIMEFRLEGKDTVYKRVEKVDYIVGSGQHTNSHIFNTNGYLHQMPMTFYTQKGQWDLPPGFENGFNTRFSRKIGLECMACHNSLPGFVLGSENKFDSLPEGISCERCHGPGSIHVQQRSTGDRIDTSKYIDYSIVNPGKLPIDLQFDVCQRCHLQGNTVLKEGKSFFDFRPGMKLSDYMSTFLPRYKNADDEFIMASHADRLKQSQCFIKSFKPEADSRSLRPYKNSLTCVTCHNPHVSVKVTGKEVFNNACKNCHHDSGSTEYSSPALSKLLCTESAKERAAVGDNCVGCHMPRSGSIDIPHVSVHDHFIRKPMKKSDIAKVKEFIGLYSINEKEPDAHTKAKAYIQQYDRFEYKQEYLDSAQAYLSDRTEADLNKNLDLLIHLNFIRKDYKKILDYTSRLGKAQLLGTSFGSRSWDNKDAWTLYRIGEAFYDAGDYQSAYAFYKKADELSPYDPEFKNKVGAALMAQQNIPQAISVFEATLREDPKYVQAISNLGYAYLVSGDPLKAEMMYNRAIALDPDYEALLMNIAGLNIYKKNYPEAKKYINRVLKKDPANEQAKQVLTQLSNLK